MGVGNLTADSLSQGEFTHRLIRKSPDFENLGEMGDALSAAGVIQMADGAQEFQGVPGREVAGQRGGGGSRVIFPLQSCV